MKKLTCRRVQLLASACAVSAKNIYIQVANNAVRPLRVPQCVELRTDSCTVGDERLERLYAAERDGEARRHRVLQLYVSPFFEIRPVFSHRVVTEGNHTATESTFDAPCLPAHVHNISLNGFDSGIEVVPNNSFLQASVPILESNVNTTFWFYDINTCGIGGVGVINANESSTETIEGFVRNAIRLNGTSATSTSASPSSTVPSSTGSSAAATTTSSSSGAGQLTLANVVLVAPLLLTGLVL